MNFERKVLFRIVKGILFLLLGIVAFAIGIIMELKAGNDSFSAGYLTGTGGGLAGVSIILIIKNSAALKNKEKLKVMKVEETDERNLLLAYKAGQYSMGITAICLYVSSFYCAFTDPKALTIITTIIGLLIGIYGLAYLVLRKIS